LDSFFGLLKTRDRGLPVWRKVLDFAQFIIDGGESIEDIKIFQDDEAFCCLRGEKENIAPRTARDLLYDLGEYCLSKFEDFERLLIKKVSSKLPQSDIATIDADATFIECDKKESKISYKGKPGFFPMFGFWVEHGLAIQGEFIEGYESSGSKGPSLFKKMHESDTSQNSKKKSSSRFSLVSIGCDGLLRTQSYRIYHWWKNDQCHESCY